MRVRRLLADCARFAGRLRRRRSGNVALTVALSLPILVLLIGGAIDFSAAIGTKSKLQDSLDAAALAVSVAVAQNPNATEASLTTLAQQQLSANDIGRSPTITSLHVCAPVQNDCTANGTTLPMNTVSVVASDLQACTVAGVLPFVCTGAGSSLPLTASTTATIGFGKTMQLNIVMDSSASMIVGSTTNDVTLISNWVSSHWAQVKPLDIDQSGDNPPCAFACHDEDTSTTAADVAQGLTNAHAAGATTRFDVMISAGQQLISHIQTEVQGNPLLQKNTYLFNVMSFDTTMHTWGASNMTTYTAAQSAVSSVSPGLDTHMSVALGQLITSIGTNGTGASASSPLKFLILVTDGLQSDRVLNYSTCTRGYDTAWQYSNVCLANQYDTTISASQCNQLKSNGIVLAILETPYVPLTGQDPRYAPYETTVRHVIYPSGPSTPSVVSAALAACASPGYYYQATNSSQIATGFATLTDEFIANTASLAK